MIEVRLSTNADDDALSNEIFNAVWPNDANTPEDAQAFKESMHDADDHLALLDGVVAGSAFTAVRPDRPQVVFGLVTVLEQYRRHGVGTALYGAISGWAAARDIATLEGFVQETDAVSRAFVAKRGFRTTERYEQMVLLVASVEDVAVAAPEGVEIIRWHEGDGLATGIYEVAAETYPDMPGAEDDVLEPFDLWLDHDLRRFDSRGATFVALASEEVVGFAQLTTSAARPGVGAHAFTAVKRDWRGKGVAGALKRAEIAWAKEHGFEQLVTQNEERNEPMLRLNERLGYRRGDARLFVTGPLSAGA